MWSSMGATIACPNGRAARDCSREESLQLAGADAYQSIDRRLRVVRAQRREHKRELARAVRDFAAPGAGLSDGVLDAGFAGPGAAGAAGAPAHRRLSRRRRGGGRVARGRIPGSCRRCSGSERATARCAPPVGLAPRSRWRCWPDTPTRSFSSSCARCRSRSATSDRRSTASAGSCSWSRPASFASSSVRCWSSRPFPRRPPPRAVIWLLRWLAMRIMLGAGLIKLRGDSCWRDLTCLDFHFETQPMPSPLTPYFHRAATLGARGRRRLQPRRRAGSAVSDPRPSSSPLRRRRADAGAAAHLDRQRQPGVSQLADAGLHPRLLRRRALAAPSSGRAGGARGGGFVGRGAVARAGAVRRGGHRRDRGAQRGADPQHAFRFAADEQLVHAAADRQHLRRVRQRRARARAAGVRRDDR